jgi:hypothetical protein
MLLGFHWAGYADLADEGDDLAALQPPGSLFLSRESKHDRRAPTRD